MTNWTHPKQKAALEPSKLSAWRCVAVVGFILAAVAACDRATAPPPQLMEGQPFPAFVLDFISSRNDTLESLNGKMLVLNIWATWCPPCRREMPGLDRLSKTLDSKRFAVIGLSADADALLASEFLLQNGITFTNFLDQNGKVSRQLGLQVYPVTFVIAPDRTLVRRMSGLHEWGSPEMVSLLEGIYQAQQRASGASMNVFK